MKAVEAMILKAARQEGAKVEVGILVTVRGRRSFLFPFSLERPVNMNPTQEMTTLRNSFLRVIPKHFDMSISVYLIEFRMFKRKEA